MAALLVLLAVGLLAASGFCPPGGDCAHSFAHALFVASTGAAPPSAPGIMDSLSPRLASSYDDVIADPAAPPPRA